MNIYWRSKVKKKTLHKTTRFEISEELRKKITMLSTHERNTISLLASSVVEKKLIPEYKILFMKRFEA
jgi:hypothetical protein